MRLTLRTMLAYLDDILEPADREEIGRKIEESEFARQLVQRLHECTRNPRLSAPKMSGKGVGPDPNTVAEYLDNTLAGERVPEFEKICLESDVDLAEVAACHQILTMVLAQPAEIDLEMKQLMYGIIDQARQAPTKPGVAAGTADERFTSLPDEIWVKPLRRKLEIPEYLRDRPKGSKWKSILAVVLFLMVLIGAIAMALGPLDRTHPLARLFGFGQPAGNQVAPAAAAGNQPAGTEAGSTALPEHEATAGTENSSGGKSNRSSDVESGTSQPVAANGSNLADKTASEKAAVDLPENGGNATIQDPLRSDVSVTVKPSTNVTPAPAAGTANVGSQERTPPPMESNSSPPPLPEPATSNAAVTPTSPDANHITSYESPPPIPTPDKPMPGDATVHSPMPTVETPPLQAMPADNTPVGRLLPSKDTVLLKFDAASGQWSCLPSGAAITANEQLLVLPTYRPTIALSAGLTLQVPPETLLEMKLPSAHGVPVVKLVYGRLVVMTTGEAGGQLSLDVGGTSGVVSFVDAEATLGVEVSHYVPAGANPEVEEPRIAADLYAVRGHLKWTPAEGAATDLNAPQRWELSPNPADATANAPVGNSTAANPATPPIMPKWINPEELRPLDAQASDFLAQSLQDNKPLLVALREMVDHRKVEFKSLGAQCLALLDEFEPLIATFNDPDQRPMWSIEIASVKAALARGSATAAKVHEAFVKQHGEELGTELYRMFLGYTKEQLEGGEATKLVDFLNHDNLDCRVLAFANLQEITNKTFNYRPEATAASRAQPLRRWQEELQNHAIVPREPASQK